ncbi:MAG: hypothetical protein ABI051_07980 [Vicinamibacterales bacterium]
MKVVTFIPKDVATQDADHPAGDVDRPLVKLGGAAPLSQNDEVVLQSLGVIRAVNVVSTLTGFSAVEDCPEEEVGPGLVLPAGRAYGQVYFPVRLLDDDRARLHASNGAMVDFDCAIEIVADGCSSLVMYTQLYSISVSLSGLPISEVWTEPGLHKRRAVSRSASD